MSDLDPVTPAEALRKEAWKAFENARDLFAAAKRETVAPYHDTLRAEANVWHDVARDLVTEADRLEALAEDGRLQPPPGNAAAGEAFARFVETQTQRFVLAGPDGRGYPAQAPQAMALEWRESSDGEVATRNGVEFRAWKSGHWRVVGATGSREPTMEAAKARCERVAAAMFGELTAKTMALTQASDVYVVTWHFYTEGGGDLSGALAVFDTEDAADAERNRLQALKPQSHTGYLVYDRDRKRAEPLITDGCTGFDVSKAGFTIARKVTP